MTIIFAEPRFHYASYEDLRQLIRLSGFQTCYIDEIDPQSNNAYIITILNGELPEGGYPGARAKIALWDLEWHVDNPPHIEGVEVWAADKWYAEQIGAKYVPMGSHVGLKIPGETKYAGTFDVAYIGFITGLQRREAIRQQLVERGVRASPIVAWGDMRDALLRASKAYLHIHQHAHIPAVPPLRMVVAAAYSLPVITEMCADQGIFKASYMLSSRYDEIAACIQDWTIGGAAQWDVLKVFGQQLHQLLCEELTFRKSVEAAL